MNGRYVHLTRIESVASLVLDRPPLNVLNQTMLRELGDALDEAAADARIKVLVIAGEGRAFCAGVDVGDHAAERVRETLALFHGALQRLLALDAPVIAAVHGPTLGGGCELALACHMRTAADTAQFGLPEVTLGIIPGYGGTQRLPRLVGRGRALELILTAQRIPADEALRQVALDCGVLERVGIHDNFFDSGGHSLTATQLVTRIRKNFAVELSLRDFIKYPTIAGLAELIEESILSKASDEKLFALVEMLESQSPA